MAEAQREFHLPPRETDDVLIDRGNRLAALANVETNPEERCRLYAELLRVRAILRHRNGRKVQAWKIVGDGDQEAPR